jgi:hypothetical protein
VVQGGDLGSKIARILGVKEGGCKGMSSDLFRRFCSLIRLLRYCGLLTCV